MLTGNIVFSSPSVPFVFIIIIVSVTEFLLRVLVCRNYGRLSFFKPTETSF